MSKLTHPSTQHATPEPGRVSVLIVDSDRQMRTLVSEWVGRAGYGSVQTHPLGLTPEIAAQCDIVFVDVRSPLQAARESVAGVLAVAPDAVIVAMSADTLASGPSAMEAVERTLGVTAVLVKPFDREALMQALTRARAAM